MRADGLTLASRVPCPARHCVVTVAACIDRYSNDPGNLRVRDAVPTVCTRCPDGATRRRDYAEGRIGGRA